MRMKLLLALLTCVLPLTAASFKSAIAFRVVTPDPLLPVSGGVGASKASTTKHGELTVRALVLEENGTRVAIVSTDFLGFPSILGDRVRAKMINPPTHTRLPRYVRGHTGTVERVLGCHVFPDSNSLGLGEDPRWLYTVRFDGRELWGPDADPTIKVSVDAWEPYLEPA